LHHFPGLSLYRRPSGFFIVQPKRNVIVILFEIFRLVTVDIKVYIHLFLIHGADYRVLDEIGIQLGVEEHILYGSGDILIIGAFYDSVFTETYEIGTTIVAENNIPELLIRNDDTTDLRLCANGFANRDPISTNLTTLVDEP